MNVIVSAANEQRRMTYEGAEDLTFTFGLAAMPLMFGLCGCSEESRSLSESADEETGVVTYSVVDYQKRIHEDRVTLSDYAKQYDEEIKAVTGTEYGKLHFDDTVFEDFPETDRLELMTAGQEEISVEDTLDICCYKYAMRRYYYGIPIMRVESGNYSFYGNYNVDGGSGEAYLADQESVAYQQINDGEKLIPLLSEDSLIGGGGRCRNSK